MKTNSLHSILIFVLLAACQSPRSSSFTFYSANEKPENTFSKQAKPKPSVKWKGNYINDQGITLNVSDPKADGTMKFDLIQSNPPCFESIHGTAKMEKPDIATYSEHDTMIITLMYNPKPEQINVSEYGYSHGNACNAFNGTYKKKN